MIELWPTRPAPPKDESGHEIFSSGKPGRAHVLAHGWLDQKRYETGHEVLGQWLSRHAGEGPRWVHLHWHMLVFELALSDWDAALERYRRAILPSAAETDLAATDAPQALLRLCWAAPQPSVVDWHPIHERAKARLDTGASHPFRALHDLLAMAGAQDLELIDWWLERNAADITPGLRDAARGVRAFAAMQDEKAIRALRRALPELSSWGGSRAQNELFHEMLRVAERRLTERGPWPGRECLTATGARVAARAA